MLQKGEISTYMGKGEVNWICALAMHSYILVLAINFLMAMLFCQDQKFRRNVLILKTFCFQSEWQDTCAFEFYQKNTSLILHFIYWNIKNNIWNKRNWNLQFPWHKDILTVWFTEYIFILILTWIKIDFIMFKFCRF